MRSTQKTFTVVGEKMFVSSCNFDPLSVQFNIEVGFIVESLELALSLQWFICNQVAQLAYQVVLADNRLQWFERDGDMTVIHQKEPGTGPSQRLIIAILSRLPGNVVATPQVQL